MVTLRINGLDASIDQVVNHLECKTLLLGDKLLVLENYKLEKMQKNNKKRRQCKNKQPARKKQLQKKKVTRCIKKMRPKMKKMQPQNLRGHASEDPKNKDSRKARGKMQNKKQFRKIQMTCVLLFVCIFACNLFCCSFQLLFLHLLCICFKFKISRIIWTLLHDTTFKQHFMFFMLRLSL